MKASRFSVIIPVFGQEVLLERCLLALQRQTFPPFEVILVDNGSSSLTSMCSTLQHLTMIVQWVALSENRYFAEAVNTGYSKASGDWVLVLNSDVVLEPDFFTRIEEAFEKNPLIHCANALLYAEDGGVDSCGVRPGKSLRPRDIRSPDRETIFGPSGAAFLLRRELCERMIREDGFLLDPKISFFYADLDLAFRLREKKIPVSLIARAKGVHKRAGSTPSQKTRLPFAYSRLTKESKALLRANRQAFLKKLGHRQRLWNVPFVWAYNLALRFF